MIGPEKDIIHDRTIEEYHEFTKKLTVAQNINASYSSAYMNNYSAYLQHVKAENYEKAAQDLQNALICISLMSENTHSEYYEAFSIIKRCSLERALKTEFDIVVNECNAIESAIKEELVRAGFTQREPIINVDQRIKRTNHLYDKIVNEDQTAQNKIDEIERFFLNKKKPLVFVPDQKGEFTRQQDKRFSLSCISVAELTKEQNIKKKSIYDFFAALHYIKKKEEQQKNKK